MNANNTWISSRKNSLIFYSVGLVTVVFLVWIMAAVLPDGIDWRQTYRPAALALLSFHTPYGPAVSVDAPFVAAAWGLIPLIPLALLPLNVGRAVLMLVSLISLAYSVYKLGATPVGTAIFLLSPPVIHCLLNGNIDWIPILGFVLPPQIGLFFITVKPQTGFAVGIFWLFQAWREGGFRSVVKTFLPVSMALLFSFGLFGLWPFQSIQALTIIQNYNASLWPASIPVGLALIVAAIRLKQAKWAMAASPCLSPYVLFPSWSSALAALSGQTIELAAAVAGLWFVAIMRL